jgi:imidazolonepropionase-like amidohydrolase
MKTLQHHFPTLSLEEIISWGTLNGSKALGIDENYGSFEKGKNPGVVWINHIRYPGPLLTEKSRSVRLL